LDYGSFPILLEGKFFMMMQNESNSVSTTDLDINISSLPQFAITNNNSSMPKENNKNHEYGMHSDVVAVIILMALYTLQGVPMGLCGSIHCC
jgi:hypothetical protein